MNLNTDYKLTEIDKLHDHLNTDDFRRSSTKTPTKIVKLLDILKENMEMGKFYK